jgi:hypothetical protein
MSMLMPSPVPIQATLARTEYTSAPLADGDGTVREGVRMLVGPPQQMSPDLPPVHQFLVYFRPDEDQLQQIQNGGFIELCLIGQVPQPFGLSVWGAPIAAPVAGHACPGPGRCAACDD